jgi:hypothetical protein
VARRVIYLRPWRRGDERKVAMRPDMQVEFEKNHWDWAAGPPGPTWTLVRHPGELIGIGGGVAAGDGVWQAWCCLAELPRGDWPLALCCARAALRHLQLRHGAVRITALVRDGFGPGIRTLEHLGFTRQTAAPTWWPGYRVMSRGG